MVVVTEQPAGSGTSSEEKKKKKKKMLDPTLREGPVGFFQLPQQVDGGSLACVAVKSQMASHLYDSFKGA